MKEVVQMLKDAAAQGSEEEMFNLGAMCKNGHGMQQDYAEAVKWYRRAADQGNANAQCSLGFMYEKGQGVQQDYA